MQMFRDITERNELQEIIRIIQQHPDSNIYIQTHNYPDPDAVATAAGLQYLLQHYGITTKIIYYGRIEKSNMKKMLEIFPVEMKEIGSGFKISETDLLILVDCQKGNSNVYDLSTQHILCIDHHHIEHEEALSQYVWHDIHAEIGACSTMIASSFIQNDIDFPEKMAGLLYYGIMIDTDNVSRGVHQLDRDLYYVLSGNYNPRDIKEITLSSIGMQDIEQYAKALSHAEQYENILFSHLEDCNDNLLGTLGDLLLTVDGVRIVVLYSIRQTGVKFSIRNSVHGIYANELIKHILFGVGAGGGHSEMAGGFITKEQYDMLICDKALHTFVKYRTISYLSSPSK